MANGDLIIVDLNKNAYLVKTAQWMVDANRIDNDTVGDAAVLVKRGAVIADVPESDIPVGYYCYLITLGQLKNPVEAGKGNDGASGSEPLGQDGLIIHTTDDAYFIVRGDQWRANPYGKPLDTDEIICQLSED